VAVYQRVMMDEFIEESGIISLLDFSFQLIKKHTFMDSITSDQRIESIVPIPSPATLAAQLPLSPECAKKTVSFRRSLSDIVKGTDKRQLVVVGPCSIHDTDACIGWDETDALLANYAKAVSNALTARG